MEVGRLLHCCNNAPDKRECALMFWRGLQRDECEVASFKCPQAVYRLLQPILRNPCCRSCSLCSR